MKKNIILILVVIGLGIAAYFLYQNQKDSTLPEKYTAFSYEHIDKVNRIELTDMKGQKAVLEKDKETWLLNEDYKANEDRVDILLSTVKRMKVRNPVPNHLNDHVKKKLASEATKVKLMVDDKAVKTFYVAGNTQDQKGTYMALDLDPKVPYVVHIPGFKGFLDLRFFADFGEWLTKAVFEAKPNEITKVEVRYREKPDSSFTLEVQDDDTYIISNKNGETYEGEVTEVRAYLVNFKSIHFDNLARKVAPSLRDEFENEPPLHFVRLTDKFGNVSELEIYPKRADQSTRFVVDEKSFDFDQNFSFGISNKRPRDILVFQYLTLNKILYNFDDFKPLDS